MIIPFPSRRAFTGRRGRLSPSGCQLDVTAFIESSRGFQRWLPWFSLTASMLLIAALELVSR